MTRFDIYPDPGPEPWDQDYEMAAAERGVELPDLPFSNPWDEPSPEEEAYYASLAHDCPREQFLDDPITQAYGVGSEMLHLIRCEICEARERD
jgi:hypothetical protein